MGPEKKIKNILFLNISINSSLKSSGLGEEFNILEIQTSVYEFSKSSEFEFWGCSFRSSIFSF